MIESQLKTKRTILSSLIFTLINMPALAQTTVESDRQDNNGRVLENVTVTAQKREQSLQDVPLSVSAMSGETIQEAGIERFEDFSAYIPNMSVTKSSISDKINIRGMQSGEQAGFEQSVGTFVNGIYRGRAAQSRFAFVDVERVEVLRGPQSILFGKNTVAGALNITSARPTEDFTAKLSASYTPEFEQSELEGMVSGELADGVRGRLVLLSREMDKGWVHNEFYDTNDPRSDELMGRATLEWDVSDSTVITAIAESADFDMGAFPHATKVAGPLAALGAIEGTDVTSMGNTNPVLNFGATQKMAGNHNEFTVMSETELDAGTLNIVAGHSAYDYERYLDADYSPLDGLRFDDTEDFSQSSLEVRFSGSAGDNFEYMTGLYWQQQDMTVDGLSLFNIPVLQQVLLGGCAAGVGAMGGDLGSVYVGGDAVATGAGVIALGGPAGLVNSCGTAAAFDGIPDGVGRYARLQQQTDTLGAFAQGTWHITDSFRTTLGLRYTSEEKSADKATYAVDFAERNTTPTEQAWVTAVSSSVGEFTTHSFNANDPGMTRKENSPTWSVNLQYDLNDSVMAYTTLSTGFKAGGFNSFYMRSPTRGNGAFSEDVSFEEEKATSFEVGLKSSLLGGAAELNVAAFQTRFEDLQAAIFSGNTTFEVQNAAEATSQGIEVDGRWMVTDNLTLSGALGLLDFSYDKFPNQACTSAQFLSEREALYQAAGAAGDIAGQLGAALGYNNALCAAAGTNDLSGRTAANAPDTTASLSASHYLPLGNYELKSNFAVNYYSDTYRSDDLDPISLEQGKAFVNAGLIFMPVDGSWQVALTGKNLTDRDHFNYINDVPLFAGAHNYMPLAGRSWNVKFSYTLGD
ncbi:TonB-dependent receptor [Microbulbifer elongatus]|uniref:TonB-dependent receptor n=1 Tax=Microbulbifer elongatus TaxID=86173 RepID=UPI001CFCF49A|nr:TonB-dependent receptor [Microbulbifer elongatus]